MDKRTQEVMFSNKKNDWETPQDFFDMLDEYYSFTIDVAADKENTKCKRFYSEKDDGLSKSWDGERVFCNPPYSHTKLWIKKAHEEIKDAKKPSIFVFLIPSRTDTKWWHNYIMSDECSKVYFVKGRLKFGGQKNSAPFPSAVVVFKTTDFITKEEKMAAQIDCECIIPKFGILKKRREKV